MCIPIHPADLPDDPDAALALYRMTRGLAASNHTGAGAVDRSLASTAGQPIAPAVPTATNVFRSDQ